MSDEPYRKTDRVPHMPTHTRARTNGRRWIQIAERKAGYRTDKRASNANPENWFSGRKMRLATVCLRVRGIDKCSCAL